MAFGDIVQGPYTASHATHPTASLGVAPTVGNLIVVVHIDVAADSAPDSPLLTARKETQASGGDDLSIYYRVVQGGDGQTYGGTSGNTSGIILWEVEGPFAASPVDQTAGDQGDVDTTQQASGTTGTTTQADEYAVAAIGDRDPAGNASGWTNSFVEVGEVNSAFASAYAAARVLTATGTYSTAATLPTGDGSRNWGAIATFKASGGGGPVALEGTGRQGPAVGLGDLYLRPPPDPFLTILFRGP